MTGPRTTQESSSLLAAPSLTLTVEQRERIKQFRADGLLWLVNTSVLHPRGLALAVHLAEDGEPIGLSVVGAGDEPWCFAAQDAAEEAAKFNTAELRRESEWSPKLRGGSG